jgi:hypothetical protein
LEQCWGSLTFWCGSGSESLDPHLWIMNPDPDPTPGPTTFFNDFKDLTKKFSYFFLITYPQVQSSFVFKINFLIFNFYILFVCSTRLWETGAGPGSIPLTSGSGSRRPKNMRIWIPNTALEPEF